MCSAIFVLSYRILIHFQSISGLGDLLGRLLISMILLTLFSLLIFSNIIGGLSNLFLSRDLDMLLASPLYPEEVFAAKGLQTALESSWMPAIFGLPIFMAYGYVYRAGVLYYLTLAHLGFALAIIAASLGLLVTMILVYLVPARRAKDFAVFMAILAGVGVYILFRFLKPERLVNPDSFFTVAHYLNALQAPRSPYLPTQWVADSLWACLGGKNTGFFHEALLTWSTAAALAVINLWTSYFIYEKGFSRAQEARKRNRGAGAILDLAARTVERLGGRIIGPIAAKEMRVFFRDNTQWSQLLLLGALVAVYIYNFSVLPLEMSPVRIDFFQNQLAFINLSLAGLVLSAVSARLVFPAVSYEGQAYWIIKSSPLRLRYFLAGKLTIYLIPLLVLGAVLVTATNSLLDAEPLIRTITTLTILLMAFAIGGMGIGLGAVYPNFKNPNIAQTATGFGAVAYMILSASYVILTALLEAGPVYILFMAKAKTDPITPLQMLFIASSFLAVLLLSLSAIILPLRLGEKALMRNGF